MNSFLLPVENIIKLKDLEIIFSPHMDMHASRLTDSS